MLFPFHLHCSCVSGLCLITIQNIKGKATHGSGTLFHQEPKSSSQKKASPPLALGFLLLFTPRGPIDPKSLLEQRHSLSLSPNRCLTNLSQRRILVSAQSCLQHYFSKDISVLFLHLIPNPRLICRERSSLSGASMFF